MSSCQKVSFWMDVLKDDTDTFNLKIFFFSDVLLAYSHHRNNKLFVKVESHKLTSLAYFPIRGENVLKKCLLLCVQSQGCQSVAVTKDGKSCNINFESTDNQRVFNVDYNSWEIDD